MHYVYVLQSQKDKTIYIGSTGDLEKRLAEHNKSKVGYTSEHRPYRLVYYEVYLDKQDALDRELKLKHHGSVIGHLKKRIKRSLITEYPPKGRD